MRFNGLNIGQTDTLVYDFGVSDGSATTANTLTVTINGANDGSPPTATTDVWVLSDATTIAAGTITANWFLNNDTDVDPGDTLYVSNVTGLPAGLTANYSGGKLVDITGTTPADGSFILTYTLSDGTNLVSGTVNVSVRDTTSVVDEIILDGNDFSYLDLLSGADTISGDTSLSGNAGKDVFIGSNGSDSLSGGAGDDWLEGNSGTDILNGGDGADSLLGGNNDDTLMGGNNDDRLTGGAGADSLTGGSGADYFIFNLTNDGIDVITDFNPADDTFQLLGTAFSAIGATLDASEFRSGAGVTTAADANDFIIYNTTTGALFYDSNGSAGGQSVQIATLSNLAALTASDFAII